MIILPKGISGFGAVDGESIQHNEYKQLCSQIRIAFHFPSFDAIEPYSGNYYIGRLSGKREGRDIFILMSQCYPILAFAGAYEHGSARFIEGDAIADYINQLEYRFSSVVEAQGNRYRVMTREELDAPINDSMLEKLGEEEIKAIKYWRPSTVKEIIFNHWD